MRGALAVLLVKWAWFGTDEYTRYDGAGAKWPSHYLGSELAPTMDETSPEIDL